MYLSELTLFDTKGKKEYTWFLNPHGVDEFIKIINDLLDEPERIIDRIH